MIPTYTTPHYKIKKIFIHIIKTFYCTIGQSSVYILAENIFDIDKYLTPHQESQSIKNVI